jgi:hypothetical protein
MKFNFSIPHPKGDFEIAMTGATPQAAMAAIQVGCELAAMMGADIGQSAPVEIKPEPVSQNMTVQEVDAEPETEEQPKVDSAGVAFDPELHTGTLKADGTWRAKRGKAEEAAALVEAVSEDAGNVDAPAAGSVETTPNGANTASEPIPAETESLSSHGNSPISSDLPEITDAELQRYCGRLAAHFGGSEKVFALAGKHVPEGEMPRPTNIKDQAARHAFVKQAEAETGVKYYG